ncbi:MAG: nucleotide pyrophosphatase [Candidatus Lokiarchaeota archaeon]|nr:nucleotide pyrophosphatase [Candidatus Lokiarchaeota archaeon]
MTQKKRVLVIGLDCATPKTLFEDFIEHCPNIRNLMDNGVYGKLRSSDPPITVPAWMIMSTGRNAGELGLYGFRHRKGNSYSDFWVANSQSVKELKIWDIIAKKGLKSIIVGVPPTFPAQPINGNLITGFITPDTLSQFTFPPELKEEILHVVKDYEFDVKFRTDNKEQLLIDLYKLTRKHFEVVKYLIMNKEWDYCQFVIIGLDRFHHAFWKYYDKSHHKYEPGNIFESAMKKFYNFLDNQIGDLLKLLNKNDVVIIASDHGAKAMKGCLCVNMALEQLGLLKFKEKPTAKTRLEDAEIDWKNTYAWGWGGYYARVFLNVKGRESTGIIEPEEYEKWREKLIALLKQITDDKGEPMDTKIYKPEDLYQIVRGDAPDLMVYFDDLNWRSAGTVGYESMYLDENDTGPDDAVHDYYGIFVISSLNRKIGKDLEVKSILDITPTILNILGIEIPEDLKGTIIEF